MTAARLIFSGTREALSVEHAARLEACARRYAADADEIGVGDCPTGVDALVRAWFLGVRVFVADWAEHGKAAGPVRNGEMVLWAAEAEHALLIASPSGNSRGTWDCVHRAAGARIASIVIPCGAKVWPP